MAKKASYEELESQVKQISNDLITKETEVESLKSMFLSNVSHEIRTPMNAIVGFSNLLSDSTYSDNQKNFFIEEINKNSKELLRLIDNVLVSSKIQSQDIKTSLSICKPEQILIKLYQSHLTRIKEANLSNLKLALFGNNSKTEIQIFTDPKKLELALSNLIENAIKFTQNGTVEFGISHSETEVMFFVRDTGKGISPKSINHIFNNFYRENNGYDAGETGLGIGLSLSDKIIKLLGGKLVVKSIPGKGSTFSFSLPIYQEKSHKI